MTSRRFEPPAKAIANLKRRMSALERRAARRGQGWQDFTPGTDITVGNGTIEARFTIAAGLVVCHFYFEFGSTSSMPNNPQNALPLDFANQVGDGNAHIGSAFMIDDSGGDYYVAICHRGASPSSFVVRWDEQSAGNGAVDPSSPFSWAAGDSIHATLTYEPA